MDLTCHVYSFLGTAPNALTTFRTCYQPYSGTKSYLFVPVLSFTSVWPWSKFGCAIKWGRRTPENTARRVKTAVWRIGRPRSSDPLPRFPISIWPSSLSLRSLPFPLVSGSPFSHCNFKSRLPSPLSRAHRRPRSSPPRGTLTLP